MFNPGSVFFVGVSNTVATFGNTDAENGLSVEGSRIVLGQAIGTAGDPARIFDGREIPFDPSTFIEMRSGTPFSTGGLSIIGITNDSTNSFQPFVMTLEQIAQLPAAVLALNATAANGTGAALQMAAEQGSGRLTVNGRNAAILPILQDAFVMNSNNNLTSIGFVTAARNAAVPGFFTFVGSDGVGALQEYFRFIPPVLANLNFGNTLAQTSTDLTVNVPGAVVGDGVLVGIPVAVQIANSDFTYFVSAANTVTIRFNNYSAAAIDPPAADFKVAVFRILP
jgi:hypothetical protein